MKQFEYSQDTQENQNVRASVTPTAVKLTCYFYYATDNSTIPSNIIGRTPGKDWNCLKTPGLTVVVLGSSDSSLSQTLGNNKFFVQSFPEGNSFNENGEQGSDESQFKFKMNDKLWTAMCILNSDLIKNARPTLPVELTKSSATVTPTWTEFINPTAASQPTFDFKKIAKQFLIQKLLEE